MKAVLFAFLSLLLIFFSFSGHTETKKTISANSKSVPKNHKIDLNKAEVNDLINAFKQINIKGVGTKKAQAIVQYRIDHGEYNSLAELAKVKGFGKDFYKNNHENLEKVFTLIKES